MKKGPITGTFIDEVLECYGHFKCFKGWYIPQECDFDRLNFKNIIHDLPALCKRKSPDKQVLISPFFNSPITWPKAHFDLDRLREEWELLFDRAHGVVDIVAFQDGTVPIERMEEYFGIIAELCKKHGIRHWVNVETFERDVRHMYYLIPFGELKRKLEIHKKYTKKMIHLSFHTS